MCRDKLQTITSRFVCLVGAELVFVWVSYIKQGVLFKCMMQKDETSTQLTSHPDQNDIVSACQVAVEQAKKSQPRQVEDNSKSKKGFVSEGEDAARPRSKASRTNHTLTEVSIQHHSSPNDVRRRTRFIGISVIEIRS